jgi:hypothetical protein
VAADFGQIRRVTVPGVTRVTSTVVLRIARLGAAIPIRVRFGSDSGLVVADRGGRFQTETVPSGAFGHETAPMRQDEGAVVGR